MRVLSFDLSALDPSSSSGAAAGARREADVKWSARYHERARLSLCPGQTGYPVSSISRLPARLREALIPSLSLPPSRLVRARVRPLSLIFFYSFSLPRLDERESA